jgi:5-methylcytosine-specific restriction endonuclease McrA
MATFDVRQQTHPAVLPQRRALESVGADTPQGRDETVHGRPVSRAPGIEHGRGEIAGIAPVQRRHPDLACAGKGAGGNAHPVVFVLDAHGCPLQPCHPARARELLACGRAVVAHHTPFTIRVKDRAVAESVVPGVEVGIDPGSRHTGIAVFTARGSSRTGVYAIQLDHRGGAIRDKLSSRSNYRRRRRSANLRYRAPRFLNRSRPEGWLAPSLKHRVDTTMSWVGRLARWAPIHRIHLERVSFDTHAMSAGRSLEGAEYQQGTLAGYEVRQYLLEKWGRACVYCGREGLPLQVEHIHPRARGGSDRISNLTLACERCNLAKNAMPITEFLAGKPALLARILKTAKVPLGAAAAMNATRSAVWRTLVGTGLPVITASGGRTKWNRSCTRSPKSHCLDALHVGELTAVTAWPRMVLVVKATGRGTYARTTPDRYGFARLTRPRIKLHHGYQTGDLVRANVAKGKKAGVHVGRVLVRSTGRFDITTRHGRVAGINHKHVRVLQRADGYGYTTQREAGSND